MEVDTYPERAGHLMVDLVNSYDHRSGQPEQLSDARAWESFLRRHQMLGPNRVAASDVAELKELRSDIRAVFEADAPEEAIRLLNALLADAGVVPWIAQRQDGSREMYYAPPEAALARRVTCDAGIGLAILMVERPDRLKLCDAEPCRMVFIDASRNRRRRWCSEACSARINVAAHRSRQRAARQVLSN